MKLYELSHSYKQVLDMMDSEEVDEEMLIDTLESIEGSIEEKLENIAKIIMVTNGDIEVFKAEEKRIATKRKSMENTVTRLKQYTLDCLNISGQTKIQAGTFSVRKQKNPPSINVVDQKRIPLKFLIPQEPKVDTKEIAKMLKSGKQVDGAEFKPESYHVRFQ